MKWIDLNVNVIYRSFLLAGSVPADCCADKWEAGKH